MMGIDKAPERLEGVVETISEVFVGNGAVIKPEFSSKGVSGEEAVREALRKTPVPKGEEK
ncbi:hypothetical protein [Thermococcus cleftensis]|uniref:hypothetical protein n=1 Tax=Thermococcus cleftensis (strain DSM 27260 / KACC 17922 / CL1) TaxID=163003 RepID=UPI00064EBCB7|nr:hypothetical protein [Thermococcus cleftensis]